jgi:hypothetical protein
METMEVVVMARRSYIFLALFILGSSLLAKVKFITSQKSFDQIVSATNPLSVIFFYNEPRKGLERDEKKAIRYARKGFKDVSYLDAYKIAEIKFGQVNLTKMPHLREEYGVSSDLQQGQIGLFKGSRHIKTSRPFTLHKDGSKDLIYNSTKNLIDLYMGNEINELIEEHVDHQRELEKIRAESVMQLSPYFLYNPFDSYYHGYHVPYWRRRGYHRPGFGMHFNF